MTEKTIFTIGSILTVLIVVGAVFLLSGTSGQKNNNYNSSIEQTPDALLKDLLNKPAPDFTLEDYNGNKISLASFKGKNVVLFFSEGLMCYPACWNQIAALADDKEFAEKDVVVLTIINDPKNDWKQAIEKMPELAPAKVLFDTDKQVSLKYNTLSLPSSMHKGLLPGHTYVVLDKKGIVRYVYDDPQMGIRNTQILEEINKF